MKVKDIIALYHFNSIFECIEVLTADSEHYVIHVEELNRIRNMDFMDKTVLRIDIYGGTLTITAE